MSGIRDFEAKASDVSTNRTYLINRRKALSVRGGTLCSTLTTQHQEMGSHGEGVTGTPICAPIHSQLFPGERILLSAYGIGNYMYATCQF